MKAVQINSYGGVEVLEVVKDIPKPTAGSGQVLVKVEAASINPFDWKLRAGYAKDYLPLQFPVTMGGDFAGVVEGIGPLAGGGVAGYVVGDEVYGQAASYGGGSGSFAEFATASIGKIAKKPKNIDFIRAASLPLVGVSAVQALEDHIKLKKGQKILIHGGAGGIGSIAIQFAKALGAYVATIVSGDDLEFARGLGADEVIDYGSRAFEKILSDFDAVFDTVGGDVANRSFLVLKKGGVIVSMQGQPSVELAKKYGVVAIGQNTDGNKGKLDRICELVEGGKIKPQVAKVFALTDVRDAFVFQEQGHPRGKVVLEI
jgi:NADPH:quinone reductase-like Zn-dependent oxidoreductase